MTLAGWQRPSAAQWDDLYAYNPKMKWNWDRTLTAILVICALITTTAVVLRSTVTTRTTASALQKTLFVKDWRSYLSKGYRIGPVSAPVQVIEFADFECPFCSSFRATLHTVRMRYPDKLALTFVNYPLSVHRFAEPAARAAECAGEQGRFEAMYDRLFERQNEFGLKTWIAFANEASVPDLSAFASCIESTNSSARIAEGRRLGDQLQIQGVPTVVVNGWKFNRPPSLEEFDKMVRAILAGEKPI